MKHLTGLQKICKLYGRMKCGDTMMVWDYANDEAVAEADMKAGSKRWMESEKKKWAQPHSTDEKKINPL